MPITEYGLKSIGFEKYPENDVLEVEFTLMHIFSIKGFTIDQVEDKKNTNIIQYDDSVRVAIGNSLNEISTNVFGDIYVDDEKSWEKEHRTSPPYLVVFLGPAEKATVSGGYRKYEEDCILTHDCFSDSKQQLREIEREKLPAVVSSLLASFSRHQQPVSIFKVVSEFIASTNQQKFLHDFIFKVSGTAFVATSISLGQIESYIESSKPLASKMLKKNLVHLYNAITEEDEFKQFLYYFLFLERYVHQIFKELNHEANTQSLTNMPERIKETGSNFIADLQKDAKNLRQRFFWCAINAWSSICDDDVRDFLKVKKMRDEISHGEEVTIDRLSINKIKCLIMKVLTDG